MPVTQLGIVYYEDDPDNFFRIVTPTLDDCELDEPASYIDAIGAVQIYRQDDGTPHTWLTLGVNPARRVAMRKVAIDYFDKPTLPPGSI